MSSLKNISKQLLTFLVFTFVCLGNAYSDEIILNIDSLNFNGRPMPIKLDSTLYESINLPPNPYLLPPVFKGEFLFDYSVDLPPFPQTKKSPLWKETNLSEYPLIDSLRLDAYRKFMNRRPDKIRYKRTVLEQIDREQPKPKENVFRQIFNIEAEPIESDINSLERFRAKRRYWTYSGNHKLHFSQSYLSDNWYSGGTGNLNMTSNHSINLNYHKNKIKFNNLISWDLSFYNNPNDTLRSIKISQDQIRTYSSYYIESFIRKWSYSSTLEIKTQAFKNHQENTNNVITSFFSPVYINPSIGMSYNLTKKSKTNKHKSTTLTVDLAPASLNYVYVMNKDVNPTRFGIEKGKRHLLNKGSTINASLTMKFNREVSFTSRFKYFTNYEKVLLESENTLNLALTRHFSTRIYLYCRFDDGVAKDEKNGYLQVSELISFGFTYSW